MASGIKGKTKKKIDAANEDDMFAGVDIGGGDQNLPDMPGVGAPLTVAKKVQPPNNGGVHVAKSTLKEDLNTKLMNQIIKQSKRELNKAPPSHPKVIESNQNKDRVGLGTPHDKETKLKQITDLLSELKSLQSEETTITTDIDSTLHIKQSVEKELVSVIEKGNIIEERVGNKRQIKANHVKTSGGQGKKGINMDLEIVNDI